MIRCRSSFPSPGLWIGQGIRCQSRWYSSKPKPSVPVLEQQSDFLETFIQEHKSTKESIEYFSATEWTRKILEDNAYETVPFFSRHLDGHTGENRFFAQTVATETTIPHLLALRLRDLHIPVTENTTVDQKDSRVPRSGDNTALRSDVLCLLALRGGLDAHPCIVHGGFQCVLIDEITRFLVLTHQNAAAVPGKRDIHYTLSMNTNFITPLRTPSNALLRAMLVRKEGRKWLTRAEIVTAGDQVVSSAESLWLTARQG